MTERLLAGYTLDKSAPVAIRDVATGFYFLRTGECDGAHRRLVLGVHKAALPTDIFGTGKLVPGRLSSVETGRGVALGDTEAQVARRMGRPSWQGGSQFAREESVWSYHQIVGAPGNRTGRKALFRFRRGRVTCIELLYDELDGG
jgi:hypothetical protein